MKNKRNIKQKWESKKLDEACLKIFSGGTPSTQNKDYWDGLLCWLSSGETRNAFIQTTDQNITQKGVDNSSTRLAKKKSVVIATAGQGLTRGQTSYLLIDTYINQSLISLEVDEQILDPLFLFYNLQSRYKELRSLSDGNSSRGSITTKMLKELNISLPPIPTQKKIASILSAFDDLIEVNTKRIKILEATAQLIYKEWFVDFKFPGHEKVKMVDSGTVFGAIPEGWKIVKIEDICNTSSGGTPSRKREEEFYKNGTIEWVKTKELNDNFILETEEKITELAVAKSSAKVFPPSTVLLAMYGATIGKLGILSKEAATNQACCAFLASNTYFSSYYIFQFLKFNIKKIIALGMGAAQQNISQQVIRKIPILQPHEAILTQYDEMIQPVFDEILLLQRQNKKMKKTRDLLLPKLVSGEEPVDDLNL